MEKIHTGHPVAWSRSGYKVERSGKTSASLALQYLTPEEFETHPARSEGKLLGAIAFGAGKPPFTPADCPFAWIDIPSLTSDTAFEIWTSNKPVVREEGEGIAASRNDDFLFGCLEIAENDDIESASHLAYCRIFDFIDTLGYAHLLRIWNYFPRINDATDGLERYRRFSIGRHDAFVAKNRGINTENIPAACALGSRSGSLVIYFLAAAKPGQPVENPRQTSAYRYPVQYGPCSPTFSRAMLTHPTQEPLLFISGTASIVGHATVHIGSASAQSRETIANIHAIIEQASLLWTSSANRGELLLKAYLRHPEHLPIVQDQLLAAFGPAMQAIYLQADICRSDLLLEVEGVCINRTDR